MKVEAEGSAVVETANARVCVSEFMGRDGVTRTSVSILARHLDEVLTQEFPVDGKPDAMRTRFIVGKMKASAA